MNGADKAAILLLYLGPECTGKVFSHLKDDEIKRIGQSMKVLGHVSRPTIEGVVKEYSQETNQDSGFYSHGEEFVKSILEKALGPQKADVLIKELYTLSGSDMVEHLGSMDARIIANFLAQEHPQTAAVILAKLRPSQSGQVIPLLPEDMQAEVVLRMADVDQIAPEILAEIDEVIRKELISLGGAGGERQKIGGVDKVVELFGHLNRDREKDIMERLDELNPPLAEIIRKQLFTFEDVFNMDDRGIQSIMREIGNDTLTLALKTCSEEVKSKIFRNISSRAAEMIKEDLEIMGPVRLSDVEKAQADIVKIAGKLEEEGKIVIAGRGGDDVLV